MGQGNFGKVYLAQNHASKKFYAIKSIRKSLLIDNDMIELCELESEILTQNNHPNLMKMEAVIVNEHIIFFVMNFI